jgi:hypothetical protein
MWSDRRSLRAVRWAVALLLMSLYSGVGGRSAQAQGVTWSKSAHAAFSSRVRLEAGGHDTLLSFELAPGERPIGAAAVRMFAQNAAKDARDATLYALRTPAPHDRSDDPRAALTERSLLGALKIQPGRAWYELDVSAFVAAEVAAGRTRVAFALRSAASDLSVVIAGEEADRHGPHLNYSTCDKDRCKPLLGIYVGNSPREVFAFERWLGRPVDGVLAYTGHRDWADYAGSVGWATRLWSTLDRTVFWSVPLIPRRASLAAAAAGAYDKHYRAAARELARFRPQDSVLYVRTAWEWNGDWFPWSVSRGQTATFIAAWRRFVDAFRSVSPRFRFDWCPSMGRVPYAWEEAYPGDAYVDVIGIDIYDESVWSDIDDPAARFEHLRKRPYGLNWLAAFAARKRRPISVAEWGVGGDGSGDNPLFVQRMQEWMMSHPVVYHAYWNSNSQYPGKLSSGQHPRASRKYRELFR